MRPCRHAGNVGTRRIGVAVLCGILFGASATAADRLPPDPAEELIHALKGITVDPANVETRAAALRNLGEMRRALAADWPVETIKTRAQLVERFQKAVRTALREGDTANRLAVITMIGELGVNVTLPVPGSDPPTFVVLAHTFTDDLTEIAKRGEPRVSEAAARALGKIATDPKAGAAVLGQLLTAPAPATRLAAADGLKDMLQVLMEGAGSTGRLAGQGDSVTLARVGSFVVPAAVKGLADSDPTVRRRCMEAILLAASVQLRVIIPRGTAIPITEVVIATERQTLAPLIRALVDHAAALARALRDADPDVRRLAGRTFESMGLARELLQRPLSPVPMNPKEERRGSEPRQQGPTLGVVENEEVPLAPVRLTLAQAGEDLLLPGLRTALPTLIEAARDPDERVRLAVIDTLESLGPEAAPAVPALTRALSDSNRFVRWSAARTLGKIGSVDGSTEAVTGLVRLLEDDDLDVRLAASLALERLGPTASAAVPALTQAVRASDAGLRIAAIRALVGIGRASAPALPALAAALSDPDARVRKTAAEALARFGPAARQAAGALTRALEDTDADVRKAASDALLSVPTDTGK